MCVHWESGTGTLRPLEPLLPAVDRLVADHLRLAVVVAQSDGLAVSARRIVVVDAVRVGPDAAVRP